MGSRGLIASAVVVVAVVALLWWHPWTQSDDGPGEIATDATPRPKAPPRKRKGAAPATIAGASSEPLRLARATATEVADAPSGRFEATVINWGSGEPVAGADVVFRGPGAAITILTDAEGRFRFQPPEEGRFGLASISAEGYLPYAPAWGAGAIDLIARSGVEIRGLIFYLTPAIAYRGVVVDAGGQPVVGATVRIVATGSGQFELMPIEDSFTSGADGRFTFSAPDFSVLEAQHGELGRGRAVLDTAVQISHEMTIKLDGDKAAVQTAKVVCLVVDPTGAPVADAIIRATIPGGDGMARPRAVTDNLGRAEIVAPAESRLRLEAKARSFSPVAAVVTVGPANSRLEETLTLGASAVIRGRVVGEGSSAVPAFTVVVTRPAGVAESVVKSASFFDAKGRFEISGLSAGDYRVSAAAYGYAPADSVAATAALPPDVDDDVVVTLPRGGTLVGVVLDADSGDPLPSARVSVEGAIGGGDSALPIASSVVTDDGGKFELAGLPPGRASIIAGAADHHSQIVGGLTVSSGDRLGPIEIKLTPTKEGERPALELAGIGAQLSANQEGLEVQRLIDGGGAVEAGIVVGDVILAVDGKAVSEVGMQRAIGLIRGPVGTSVELRIRRADGQEELITAYRRKIRA